MTSWKSITSRAQRGVRIRRTSGICMTGRLKVKSCPDLQARRRLRVSAGRWGKMSWLATTRRDLVYFISVLARGQADPREYHERAIRHTLRCFKTVSSFFQIFPRQRDQDLRIRVFVDASWGSERSVSRRSISGGCVMLGSACVKSWARLQQSVALSSAESELYALTEGARESMGLRCSVGHVTGLQPESQYVPTIYCDCEAAINISKMEGLKKLRHIDLRVCFIQHEVQSGSIVVKPVRGKDNPADIFTKSLDGPSHYTSPHGQLGARGSPAEKRVCVCCGSSEGCCVERGVGILG